MCQCHEGPFRGGSMEFPLGYCKAQLWVAILCSSYAASKSSSRGLCKASLGGLFPRKAFCGVLLWEGPL